MINYNILAKERKEKGVTWGYLESCISSGYRGKFVDFKKGKTSLTNSEEKSLAQVLGVSVDYLSGKEKQKEKPAAKRSELINKILTVCDGLPEDKQTELLNYAKYLVAKNK
jgi:transcriptional regulator with XRE-family HTH domain